MTYLEVLLCSLRTTEAIKLKGFLTAQETIKKMKNNLYNGTKYFQTVYLIRGLYPKYVRDSYNSIGKKKKESEF